MNDASLYAPGELGQTFDYNDRTYQIVKVDSGAAATVALAANQLLYWKDRANYLVTNDFRVAEGGSLGTNAPANSPAGILRNAATAGYYIAMLVRGRNIACADDGSCAVGETAHADLTASQARVTGEAVGTASTYKSVGRVRTASSSNVAYVDVDIPEIP
jgi:hypothetical protein